MKTKLLAAFLLGALLVQTGLAQNGYEQIVAIAKGSYVATTVVSAGTGADVALFPGNGKRVDMTCRNNSAFILYIGAAGVTSATGFPILANETFEVGAMSGNLYGIGSGGTVDVRCFEGAIR